MFPPNVGSRQTTSATFPVTAGLPSDNNGFLTYDNLFWPGGAPPTASDFDGAGGFLDIYGLMFTLGGDNVARGTVVDLFDNGVSPTTGVNYGGFGVAIATSARSSELCCGRRHGDRCQSPRPGR